ncbi:MAG: DUF4058 family protein [Pirellulaceae bacterium]
MPSPFPGMDPFIEDQEWEDFHASFNAVLSEALAPAIERHYVARLDRRFYVEHGLGDDEQASPSPQERRETFLVIREQQTMEIVTVIETLSPANKRASSDGREQYLAKREEILASRTNLVELDLLRGGKRLPVVGMPPGDYFAVISRGYRRPRADVFAWTLRQSLPKIPIPLKKGEPEASLDLQHALTTVYDRARYQLSLRYGSSLSVPLSEADAAWLRPNIPSPLA